jgi:flagellar hook-associated protein 2
MTAISSGTGLVTGFDISGTVSKLMAIEQKPVTDLTNTNTTLQTQETALNTLAGLLLGVQSVAKTLEKDAPYATRTASTSSPTVLSATVTGTPAVGSYQFTPLQLAQNQQWLSSAVTGSTAALGGGTFSFRYGAGVDQSAELSWLNNGAGINPGQITITAHNGASATVDLAAAQSVNDVLDAINGTGIGVTATAVGNHFVLTDSTTGTTNLSVKDADGSGAAASLGLGSVNTANQSATGDDVVQLYSGLALGALNDGAGVHFSTVLPDISYTLANGHSGTIDLSPILANSSTVVKENTVGDVLKVLNAADPTELQFSISGNRLVAKDLTSGTGSFTLQSLNDSDAVHGLGLDSTAQSGTITGRSLLAGLQGVLLSSLNGGQGLGSLGSLSITNHNGTTTSVNLAGKQTLQEVIGAINTAGAGVTAAVNQAGNGIQLTDTTGGTASKLIVANGDSSTTAQALGLATGATGTSATTVNSGDLHLRVISRNTTLASMNGGSGVAAGTMTITDSSGTMATLNVTSSMTTVGDVIDAINRLGTKVRADLNATGDGISLTDNAGGTGSLIVSEGNSTTGGDLHLLGTGATSNNSSHQTISGSSIESITLASTDSLTDLATKINALKAGVTASVFTQSAGGAARLSLVSNQSGRAGAILLDASQINLAMSQTVAAQDAVISLGSGAGTGGSVTVTSSSNTFQNVLSGVDLQVTGTSDTPVTVSVNNSSSNVVSSLQTMVSDYNSFRSQLKTLTSYDTSSNTGAALFGDATVLRMETELSSLVSGSTSGLGTIGSLADLGVRVNTDGTLALDTTKLQAAYAANPDAVQAFFSTKTTGFAARLDQTIENLAGENSSAVSTRVSALADKISTNQDKITAMNARLTTVQNQLYLEFYNMETTVSKLKNEMSMLDAIAYIQPVNYSSGNSGSSSSG